MDAVDYDSYVDIRRPLIVGGPQTEIPHTVCHAVLAVEAEEEESRATGASTMRASCPKCVSHMECLKFEGDERYQNIEILDVVSCLARQVDK